MNIPGNLTLLEAMKVQTLLRYRNQAGLAAALGVSPVFVSGVLSGKKSPPTRLLDLLGIEMTWRWKDCDAVCASPSGRSARSDDKEPPATSIEGGAKP